MDNIKTKSFTVDFDAIIKLGAGFEDYFAKHPEEEKDFPRCNDPIESKRKKVKTLEMFVGKKTENFEKLLELLEIKVDSAFLEAKYYLTAPGEGSIFKIQDKTVSIAFDLRVDPTAQIEYCRIEVSYPEERDAQIVDVIWKLLIASVYPLKYIHDGDLKSYKQRIGKPTKRKTKFFDLLSEYRSPKIIAYTSLTIVFLKGLLHILNPTLLPESVVEYTIIGWLIFVVAWLVWLVMSLTIKCKKR